MNELTIGNYAVLGMLGLTITCWLWQIGGRAGGPGKWARRYVGSATIVSTVLLLFYLMNKFEPWLLVLYVTTAAGFTAGYGGESLKERITRRSVFVLANLLGGFLLAISFGGNAWSLFALHAFVASGTIWLGVKNPVHAASEEVFVCALLNFGLITYPFIV